MSEGLTPAQTAALAGRRVLVAEDEYMLAMDVAAMLSKAGAEVLGPVGSVGDALRITEVERLDAALLDVNLHDEFVWPVVDALLARDVPVVLTTGYDASAIPECYAGLPRCEKPIFERELIEALVTATSKTRS